MLQYEEFKKEIHECSPNTDGPISKTLSLLTGKWVCLVIYELLKKSPLRFGELQSAIPGITRAMLSSTLKKLEQNGIVQREQFNEIPPHVEYSITEAGQEMLPIFYEFSRWGLNHMTELGIPEDKFEYPCH